MCRLLLALLILAAATLVVSCGGDDTTSADEAAQEFEEGIAETGGEAVDIECEDAVEENYFDCTGKIAGFESSFQLKLEGETIDLV